MNLKNKITSTILAAGFGLLLGCQSSEISPFPTRNPPRLEEIVTIDKDILDFVSRKEVNKKAMLYPGFLPYVLSHLTEGFYYLSSKNPSIKKEAISFIENIIKLNLKTWPYQKPITKNLVLDGLYLSNLNLQLGLYKKLSGSDKYFNLNKKISYYLAEISLRDKYKQFPSYPSGHVYSNFRWVNDQAVTLYTIKLFDENYNENISERPTKEWFKYIEENSIDKRYGIPITDLACRRKELCLPRGSAISNLTKYVAQLDKEKARVWWENYKKHFLVNAGPIAGFREYPPGCFYSADLDSGPIFGGIGASATAFGIGSAKSLGDNSLASKLEKLATIGTDLAPLYLSGKKQRVANDLVAKALLFSALNTLSVP